MKISVLSGLFSRFPLEKTFKMVSDIGFDGIELHGLRPHAYPYDMDEKRCDDVLRLKEQYSLEISMYTPELLMYPYNLTSPYKKEKDETVDYVKKSIEVARSVGAKRVQVTCGHAGYFTDRRSNMANLTDSLKQVAEHAEKFDVDLVVEALTIMESNTAVMLDDLVEILDRVGSPNVKSMLDSAMVMTNWEPVDDYFGKLGERLVYVHWGDSMGTAENHLPIGNGMIDARSFFDILRRHGYDGWVSLELFGKYIREPEMHAARELRLLRESLSNTKERRA
jgi:protein FrlC